jgi:hypothetical protein
MPEVIAETSKTAGAPRGTDTLQIHCLLHSGYVDMAAMCLGSLQRFSDQPLSLMIHDDRSLTPANHETLLAALTRTQIVRRSQADERMEDLLHRHPACAAFRRANTFGLKLLDICLLGNDDTIAYVDADILFVRPFAGFFTIPPHAGGIVLRDVESVYGIRSWHLLRPRGLALARNVNAGLLCLRRSAFDLDLLEWYLSQPRHFTKSYFTEQTAWAMLAQNKNFVMWDAAQARVIRITDRPDDRLIAGHFAGGSRCLLPLFHQKSLLPEAPRVSPRTLPLKRAGFAHLARVESWRIARRFAARGKPATT